MSDGDNPMHKAHAAPRCSARCKRTGAPCQGPAVAGWSVCRMHGAGGGHAAGKAHPSWRHGLRSRAWIEARREVNALIRQSRQIERMIPHHPAKEC